jgi:hypothetical protein
LEQESQRRTNTKTFFPCYAQEEGFS